MSERTLWDQIMHEKSLLEAQAPAGYQPPESVADLLVRYTRGERYFVGADIPDGANLENACLEGATLAHCWLSDANLRGANLRNVDFSHTNLKCSDFRDAHLEGACFRGALIEATNFEGAKVAAANLVGATAYGHTFNEQDAITFLNGAPGAD